MIRSGVSPLLVLAACLLGAASLSGCQSAADRSQAALTAYQAAEAAGDLGGQRKALLQLVTSDEDNADYWASLGKVQLALHAYPDAFYAFTRAQELNRDDPSLLRILTQLALASNDLELASSLTKKLELIQPGDPAVVMTQGVIALQRGDLPQAAAMADRIGSAGGLSPQASVLKSQVLMREGKADDAIALLKEQLKTSPLDPSVLKAMASLYERREDWAEVAPLRRRLWLANKANVDLAVAYVDAAFKAGNAEDARWASLELLKPDASPLTIVPVLDQWATDWSGPERVAQARRLAAAAGPAQQLAYAGFLNRVGAPAEGLKLASPQARLPVTAPTVRANTLVAESLLLTGNLAAARARLDAVLAIDPDNPDAIRSRARLGLASRNGSAAIYDGRKLVSMLPGSAPDRLLLANIYLATGDRREALRTLWDGFHDIPADPMIHRALRNMLIKLGQTDAATSLDREFADQREAKFTKELAA